MSMTGGDIYYEIQVLLIALIFASYIAISATAAKSIAGRCFTNYNMYYMFWVHRNIPYISVLKIPVVCY